MCDIIDLVLLLNICDSYVLGGIIAVELFEHNNRKLKATTIPASFEVNQTTAAVLKQQWPPSYIRLV